MPSNPDLSADRFLRFVGRCNSWPLVWRILAATALVLLATAVRSLLSVEFGSRFIYVSYFPAVSTAAMMTGVAGGAIATLLSVILAHVGSDTQFNVADLIRAVGFVAGSSVTIGMARLLHMGRDRLAVSEAARHDEEQLRQFIEQAPVALAMFDEQMRYIASSRRWRDDYDLDDQDIIGRSHYEIFPEVSEAWKKIHRRGLSGEIVRADDDFFLRTNGDKQWLRWETRPWYRDGNIAGIIIFSEDITVRKQSEEKVLRSEARFRTMFENSSVGMAQVSSAGHFLRVNERLCEMLGYSQTEMEGLLFQQLTHPEDIAADLLEGWRLRAGEIDRFDREQRYIRKDGSVVWGHLSAGAVRTASKKLAYQVAVIEDITERKRAEDALRKFSRVIEQTASTVVITDADGIIEYVNPHFSEITGYTAEEAIGKRPDMWKSSHASPVADDELWHTIQSGQVWRGEFHNSRKDGSLFWEAAIVSPIRNNDGAISHFVAIQDDITQRKEIENQFAATQSLEAVGRLAGGIAHDFNNLLAVISGNLELIKQRSEDDRVQSLVKPALAAALAGAAFNRRILSLSGRQTRLGSATFVVNDRISDTKILFDHTIDPRIKLKYVLADDLWPTTADPGELDSALLNLVINSRDAMPNGGEIIVQTQNEHLDIRNTHALLKGAKPGDYACISVSDNGVGMRKEVLEHALEPFFTTKTEERGTGLGLSTVRNFAVEARGFVTIESQEGLGTAVKIYLPRTQQESVVRNDAIEKTEIPLGDGECVLVVEDDERVRDVTLKRIEALGYVAEQARSGSEAFALLKSGLSIDLVLSDIVMPGVMSGLDLARRVRAEMPTIGFVLSTGYSGEPLGKTQTLNVPVLHKPYTREQLARSLAKNLRKRA
jgi:two-component system cell cycle sensor histidine kinase/response regulator CckA